ncbi:MAG: DUF6841 family protein [Myxococcota bacterium]
MGDPFELYFRTYAAAFDAFDADEIAAHFHCPCLMVNSEIAVPLTARHAIVSNMRAVLSHHRAEGYSRAAVTDVASRLQAAQLATVEVGWRVTRADESLLWEWRVTYNLVDYEDRWQILVATTHGPT